MALNSGNYVGHPQSVCGPKGRQLSNQVYSLYDNAEWVIGTGSDINFADTITNLFNNITTARYVSIRSDGTLPIKLNSASNDLITIEANTEFVMDALEVTNIFASPASSMNVKVFLTGE